MQCYQNILLHIPHASVLFPEDVCYSFNDLDEEERQLVDYYTDELFITSHDSPHISSMVFPYCRLYCDVERLIKDPLEKVGLGISYRRRMPAGIIRAFSILTSAFRLYAHFHAEMSTRIVEYGHPLLIDCHSFSSIPNLLNSNPPDIDICIGYNEDETCPDIVVINSIAQHFKSCGYKVGINTPFSNSKTFDVPVNYHSVMIEVNKRLYMNEYTLEKTEGFGKLKQDIQSLYELLLKNK
ncbi:MAG: N-formylglutamate amidohydrolase [Prevotella sp.]|nr:N-formylglutamate amidohydrolase [Prevotella sp.]